MNRKDKLTFLVVSIAYWVLILSLVWSIFQTKYGGVLSKTVWIDPSRSIGYPYVAGQNFVFFSILRAFSLYVAGSGIYIWWKAKTTEGDEKNVWASILSSLMKLLCITAIFSIVGAYIFVFLFLFFEGDWLTSLSLIIVLYICTMIVLSYLSKKKLKTSH